MLLFLGLLIIVLGTANMIRWAFLMVAADLHDLQVVKRPKRPNWKPAITIIIPAYNEELGIVRCLESLAANSYSRKEIMVVNDGSTDRTSQKVRNWQRTHRSVAVRLINQPNGGKASAINNGIKKAKGSLIMVLDADSILAPNALEEVPKYFTDPRVVLMSANVKVIDDGRILSLVQKYEYLISYRLKKALMFYNMEYIVGGVGSTFRKSMAKSVGSYDTDTMTEDIDFTLKILKKGNIKHRLAYAPSVIAYTEGVMTLRDLIKQRYRWKYGRMQTFVKNRELFFNRHSRYDKRLTHYQLPYAVLSEVLFSLEPLLIGYFLLIVLLYHDTYSLISAYTVTTGYIIWNIVTDESESRRSKTRLVFLSIFQYPLLLIMSVVEYCALVKSARRLHQLRSTQSHGAWEHVARSGKSMTTRA